MAANITVHEFTLSPLADGSLPWPASVTTRGDSADTVTLAATTRCIATLQNLSTF